MTIPLIDPMRPQEMYHEAMSERTFELIKPGGMAKRNEASETRAKAHARQLKTPAGSACDVGEICSGRKLDRDQ